MCGHQWNDLFSRHGNHCSWEMWWKVGSWFHNIHWDSMLPATSEVQVYPHISLSTEPPDESILRGNQPMNQIGHQPSEVGQTNLISPKVEALYLWFFNVVYSYSMLYNGIIIWWGIFWAFPRSLRYFFGKWSRVLRSWSRLPPSPLSTMALQRVVRFVCTSRFLMFFRLGQENTKEDSRIFKTDCPVAWRWKLCKNGFSFMVQVVWYPRLIKILFRVVSPMIYCNDCVYGAHVLRNLATCQDLSLQYFLCWENAWRIATVDFWGKQIQIIWIWMLWYDSLCLMHVWCVRMRLSLIDWL